MTSKICFRGFPGMVGPWVPNATPGVANVTSGLIELFDGNQWVRARAGDFLRA